MTTPSPQKKPKIKTQNLVSSNSKHVLEFPLIRNLGRATLSASRSRSFWDCRRGVGQGCGFIWMPEGGQKGKGSTSMLTYIVIGRSLYFFLHPNSQHGSHRKNDQRERENERKGESLHSSWKPQSFYDLVSELTSHHFSVFARCKLTTKERELQVVNARIQRSLVATLEDTCHTAPHKQQS